ncbi:transmembrane protein, putative (macronuclear) [Tetrahymena thermophila SB210]|uniref:Transmembrane protein, putative n=1 Tax=Tetrahymena thermophila (strain SB210) TaxID=312017 RepID=I7M3C0_TETTS|nr:transmembrane protein, putative [Tetrahymena thermophila SB210]EAS02856.2 transmembrane protein, putative [Tetrahymena thermophila SB210]|eukprot:XP_001023101.2 transmembrane protein, putative [Tetrahymena thermophila SB210]
MKINFNLIFIYSFLYSYSKLYIACIFIIKTSFFLTPIFQITGTLLINFKLFKQILITIKNSLIEMEKNQNDLQAIYNLVSKRYLQLKRESKSIKQEYQSPLNNSDEDSINTRSCLKHKIDSKNKSYFSSKKQLVSQQEFKNYQDEYKKAFIGREKAFYIKYKNDLNAIKFLKHCLFSQINQLDFSQCVQGNNLCLQKKDLRTRMKEVYSYINQKQIMVFLILGLVMFGYNLWNQYQEIIIEKKTLDEFRLRYENESEALYQILKQKHALYEKIKRHKDFGIIQSLLNRQIKLKFSFIFGVLSLLLSLFKALFYHFSHNKIRPMPLFQGLNIELQKQYLNQAKISQQNQDKPKIVDPQQISQIFQQQKMVKEQKFMDIFNQQKEYILKRQHEELIKKEILEQKKNQLLQQLNYLNKQKQVSQEKKRQNQRNTLSMCSFQNSETDNNENHEQLSFVSQHYNYDQFHQSEDEDYDLPQFGQKKSINQLNKFPKRSKLTIQPKQQFNNSMHIRSKSIGSVFQIINTKNESESYKYCERLF